ncbi:hypothetical protein VTK73DRAFT_9821 [Phialemonium thermophilum]|uniref:Zn(2)-C6 fungal-type domain-containing protein n=1 Tax=Phialemonium thermophilum TaxID=223376 RepID=A0ABR3XJA6_9PEZI
MASATSLGASPHSGTESLHADSVGDHDENFWHMVSTISASRSSTSSTTGFSFSPASGSLSSWTMVGGRGHQAVHHSPPPAALSPLHLDSASFSAPLYGEGTTEASSAFGLATAGPADGSFVTDPAAPDVQQLMNAGELVFDGPVFDTNLDLTSFMNSFNALQSTEPSLHSRDQHQTPQTLQSSPSSSSWDPANLSLRSSESPFFLMDDLGSLSPSPPLFHPPSVSPSASASSQAASYHSNERETVTNSKRKSGTIAPGNPPVSIHRVQSGARVQKRRPTLSASQNNVSRNNYSTSTSKSGTGSGVSQFLIVTPDSVNAHAGKPNPFECFEAARPSQKGRKGPLADNTKENALQVRRLGACFCCHARKVRCDTERPCRNCKKLMQLEPEVICWQFPDFLPVLFPSFIRSHFQKEEMARFLSENVESFTVDGVEKPCVVELFSGASFRTTLQLKAKFFTPKTNEVLQHWHLNVGRAGVELQAHAAAPIGLDTSHGAADGSKSSSGSSRREEVRKKARDYIQGIVQEPTLATQLTDSLRHTDLPRRILATVQRYAARTDAAVVHKALSVYAMHYVLTRHLCLTARSAASLLPTGEGGMMTPPPWVTLRVLNRQVKAVVDEMLAREVQALFERFGKSLKPKLRREWAPCLAAFLVLCLFMESVETAADAFVVSQNEIDLRCGGSDRSPRYSRAFALGVNKEVENLPFKQFAFQFHQVYQTHSRDAAAKSFNPLVDETATDQAELDEPAMELVRDLRQLIQDPAQWAELDYLCADPYLPTEEEHPFPRDTSFNYTGHLVAKFLLSFTDEKYIFQRR